MIDPCPYTPLAAMMVLQDLDPHDGLEVERTIGHRPPAAGLLVDWHGWQTGALLSLVIRSAAGTPFAVLMIGRANAVGTAGAALLARDHRRWAPELRALAREVRADLPFFAARHGLTRIEARAWSGHPRAGRLLHHCGFRLEAELPGFGPTGADTFLQFAWTRAAPAPDPKTAPTPRRHPHPTKET